MLKRGQQGSCVYLADGQVVEAPPFPVEVLNILGAGDAYAAGLITGRTRGWDWRKSLRLANATGAIVVTMRGCANFMPTEQEAIQFIESNGGF